MKKNMYIQPDVQVTEMTGMRIMDVVSPPGNIGVADGGTENLGAIVDGD